MQAERYAADYQTGLHATIRILLSKGLMMEDAEELAQAAWVRGWEARHQLKRTDRVIPWVNSIAVNTMYNQKRRMQRFDALDEAKLGEQPSTDLPARIDAERLLSRCSELDQSLIMQRYAGGYGMEEIAQSHGISCAATRVRIHRAKAALRQLVSKKPLRKAA